MTTWPVKIHPPSGILEEICRTTPGRTGMRSRSTHDIHRCDDVSSRRPRVLPVAWSHDLSRIDVPHRHRTGLRPRRPLAPCPAIPSRVTQATSLPCHELTPLPASTSFTKAMVWGTSTAAEARCQPRSGRQAVGAERRGWTGRQVVLWGRAWLLAGLIDCVPA